MIQDVYLLILFYLRLFKNKLLLIIILLGYILSIIFEWHQIFIDLDWIDMIQIFTLLILKGKSY